MHTTKNILLIEPDLELGELLVTVIEEQFNAIVTHVTSSHEAHDLVAYHKYDLIILEQVICGTKGSKTINLLKNKNMLDTEIPILYFTVYSNEVIKESHCLKNTFILDKTASMDKFLVWVKILLFSQTKEAKVKRRKERDEQALNCIRDEIFAVLSQQAAS